MEVAIGVKLSDELTLMDKWVSTGEETSSKFRRWERRFWAEAPVWAKVCKSSRQVLSLGCIEICYKEGGWEHTLDQTTKGLEHRNLKSLLCVITFIFFHCIYLSNLDTQREAWTHHPRIKNYLRLQLSQPGTPIIITLYK